jgi:4-amino-4-deoxy-L-arabinose transferase-like glycosyltransferase
MPIDPAVSIRPDDPAPESVGTVSSDSSTGRARLVTGLDRLAPWLLIGGLVLFHAINNWIWLTTNVTILGWDVPSHLGTSFIYNSMLQPLSPRTLFEAITWHPNRPPLYFLSAVPLFRIFGLSADVGTMVNTVYLAVLFGSVYGIGRRLGGRRVGLLATFVVGTLPMIFAISRFFYLELALTAMVALSVYLLLSSDRFENRTASLLFGLVLGLGLLTKRTYFVFVWAPLCLIVLRSNALESLKRRLRGGFRLDLGGALLALAIGLALAIAWYWPAREVASQLPLGLWLVPIWAALVAVTIYLVRLEQGPDTNILSALFLGATVSSLWYLPRITFIERLLRFGFGVNDPWDRSANLDQLHTYLYFLTRLVNEHLSLVYFAFLLAGALGLLYALYRRGNIGNTLRRASDAWWVTGLWVLGSYLLLTISLYRKSRGTVPILPALALIMAAGLFHLPWKRLVRLLVALLVAWGFLQFFVLSYERPHRLADQTSFYLPVLGDTGLFARGGTIQLPDSGDTDRAYWVVPDVLRIVEARRQAANAGAAQLGVLVNNEHVNPDLFGVLALQSYPAIQAHNLARSGIGGSIYPHLFWYDYLVLIEKDYKWIDAAAQQALRELGEEPELFDAVFELAGRFPLPDGDAVLLYGKVQQPAAAYNLGDYQQAAGTIAARAQEGDAVLLIPPDQAGAVGQTLGGQLPVYLLPEAQPPDREDTASELGEITSQHPMLFALFLGEEAADPERVVEGWLNEHAYRSQTEWYGGVRLVSYGAPTGVEEIAHPLGIRLGDRVELLGYNLADQVAEPGRLVRLTLLWRAADPISERLAVFAHLLDGEGQLVAQQDSEPVGGNRPTTTWTAGETITDRLGILIPSELAAGEYQLVVGMYHPDIGERLVIDDDSDAVINGDSLRLTTIQVE